ARRSIAGSPEPPAFRSVTRPLLLPQTSSPGSNSCCSVPAHSSRTKHSCRQDCEARCRRSAFQKVKSHSMLHSKRVSSSPVRQSRQPGSLSLRSKPHHGVALLLHPCQVEPACLRDSRWIPVSSPPLPAGHGRDRHKHVAPSREVWPSGGPQLQRLWQLEAIPRQQGGTRSRLMYEASLPPPSIRGEDGKSRSNGHGSYDLAADCKPRSKLLSFDCRAQGDTF